MYSNKKLKKNRGKLRDFYFVCLYNKVNFMGLSYFIQGKMAYGKMKPLFYIP